MAEAEIGAHRAAGEGALWCKVENNPIYPVDKRFEKV